MSLFERTMNLWNSLYAVKSVHIVFVSIVPPQIRLVLTLLKCPCGLLCQFVVCFLYFVCVFDMFRSHGLALPIYGSTGAVSFLTDDINCEHRSLDSIVSKACVRS